MFQMEKGDRPSQREATTNSSGTSQQSVPVAQQPSAVDPDTAFVKAEVVDHGTSIDTEVRDYQTHTMFHNPSVDTPALNQLRQNVSFVASDRMNLTHSSFTLMDTVPTALDNAEETLGAQSSPRRQPLSEAPLATPVQGRYNLRPRKRSQTAWRPSRKSPDPTTSAFTSSSLGRGMSDSRGIASSSPAVLGPKLFRLGTEQPSISATALITENRVYSAPHGEVHLDTRASIEDEHETYEEDLTNPGIVHPTSYLEAPADTTEAVSAGLPARQPFSSGLKEEEKETQPTHNQQSGIRPGVVIYDKTQQLIRPVTRGNKNPFLSFRDRTDGSTSSRIQDDQLEHLEVPQPQPVSASGPGSQSGAAAMSGLPPGENTSQFDTTVKLLETVFTKEDLDNPPSSPILEESNNNDLDLMCYEPSTLSLLLTPV